VIFQIASVFGCCSAVCLVAFQEIFGPILSVYVYDDESYKDILNLIDLTSAYGLTGSVFAKDE